MDDELIKSLRDCAEVNSLSLYKRGLMKQAADAIEKLSMRLHGDEAAIAGMKREIERMVVTDKPRWIPVTERLPDADGFTLIFTAHGNPGVCYFTSGWWGGYDKDGITHWMPLPQPPKEEV